MNQQQQVQTHYQQQQANSNNNQQTVAHNINNSNKSDKKKKLAVKWLGIVEIGMSIVLICLGVTQLGLMHAPCYRESMTYHDDVSGHRVEGLWTRCWNRSMGENIWCSLFPLVAGIFGVLASSKTAEKKQFSLLMGFSIVGAIMMLTNVIISTALSLTSWSHTIAAIKLKATSAILAGINFVLLIISASFSCCFFNCCKQQSQTRQVVYVTYTAPNQPQPVVVTNTQGAHRHVIMLEPSSNLQQPQPVAQQPQQQQTCSNAESQQQQVDVVKKSPPEYKKFENHE